MRFTPTTTALITALLTTAARAQDASALESVLSQATNPAYIQSLLTDSALQQSIFSQAGTTIPSDELSQVASLASEDPAAFTSVIQSVGSLEASILGTTGGSIASEATSAASSIGSRVSSIVSSATAQASSASNSGSSGSLAGSSGFSAVLGMGAAAFAGIFGLAVLL